MSRPFADADVFRVVASPTRRRILDLLSKRDLTPAELFSSMNHSRSTLSEHLRMLRSIGLLTQLRKGKHRVYHLHPIHLKEIERWISPYITKM